MKKLKRLGSIVALSVVPMVSIETTTHAGSMSGTFQGVADIYVQQYVDNTLVTSIAATWVPSTINFSLVVSPSLSAMDFYIDNSVFPYGFEGPAAASIIDGIPGQTADYASGSYVLFSPYASSRADFNLVDPNGEYIGPNGNGDPSEVKLHMSIYELYVDPYGASTESIIVQFQTVPEPSSIVLAASGALIVLTVALARARRANHP